MIEGQPHFLVPDWPAPENVHALNTVRTGGKSRGVYTSFNLGAHVGDEPEHLAENRRRLQQTGALPTEPVWLTQVHGKKVVHAATTAIDVEADGIYTDRPGRVCAVLTADCLPIFVCNRQGTEVGLLHAGWRGLAAGIVEAGLDAFQSATRDLLIWFGPAIGPRAYEVGNDVRDAFALRDPLAAQAFVAGANGKWFMDIYRLARQRLAARGVTSIYGGEHCTMTEAEMFFSYRRDGITGRMASLIWFE